MRGNFMKQKLYVNINPLDTGCKWNVHKMFRRRPRRLLNVLCTFYLYPVSRGALRNTLKKYVILSRLYFDVYGLNT